MVLLFLKECSYPCFDDTNIRAMALDGQWTSRPQESFLGCFTNHRVEKHGPWEGWGSGMHRTMFQWRMCVYLPTGIGKSWQPMREGVSDRWCPLPRSVCGQPSLSPLPGLCGIVPITVRFKCLKPAEPVVWRLWSQHVGDRDRRCWAWRLTWTIGRSRPARTTVWACFNKPKLQ